MYPSVIDAKIQNLGGYASGLLDGTQPIHRADRDKLRIETISFVREDGTRIDDVRAILQPTPNNTDKLTALIEKLHEKSRKFSSYRAECDVVDLVIWDRGSIFGNKVDFEPVHMAPAETRRQIIGSPFREVFLLTRSPEPSKFFFYPLRANIFLADALLLDHLFLEAGPDLPENMRLQILCECLRRMGHPVALSSEPDGPSLHTPGWQMLISGLDINMRDWTTSGRVQPSMEISSSAESGVLRLAERILTASTGHRCSTTVALVSRAT